MISYVYWICASFIITATKVDNKPSHSTIFKNQDNVIGHEKIINIVMTNNVSPIVCAGAIDDAFQLSWNSSRIKVHVYDDMHQHSMSRCIQYYCKMRQQSCQALLRSGKLRASFRHWTEWSGISEKKHFAEQLLNLELKKSDEFVLSVDASAVFEREWDVIVLEQWYLAGNNRAIVTVSPKAYDLRTDLESVVLDHCSARMVTRYSYNVVEYNPPTNKLRSDPKFFPILQSHHSEAFVFGPIKSIIQTPSDPYLTYATTGYVYTRAARFWTGGFDFYAPSKDVLTTHYDLEITKKASTRDVSTLQYSYKRICALFGIGDDELEDRERYYLGNVRSLDSWYHFSHIDPASSPDKTTNNQFVHCNRELSYMHY